MRALICRQWGKVDELAVGEAPVPKPAADEVLIKVAAAGVNRPDVFQRQGNYPPPPGASPIPGLEIAGTIVALVFARDLDLFLAGEETAASLGVDVQRVKRVVLVTAALLTSAAVAVSGVIGFVGLIVPHIVRLLVGPEGGFSNEEEDAALAAGAIALSMGPRVLRTETACLAALAVLAAAWGGI